MSRLKEYEEQEKERQRVGAKSREFYKTVNVPGDRTKGQGEDLAKARAMIEAMKKARTRPNYDKAD